MTTIVVVDYGMGNLRSVSKALEHADPRARVMVSNDPQVIRAADKVVFPGQGAIRGCMSELQRLDLLDVVAEVALDRPFLGICLGMQALLEHSEENAGVDGLGLVPGRVRHFRDGFAEAGVDVPGKVPLMGWVRVSFTRPHPLFAGITDPTWFYFVHSYFVGVIPGWTVGTATYGIEFSAALARANIMAVQFHPEKSQHAGLRMLHNFCQWDGRDRVE
jgi:imidazole glycerol-phosphate synthase subunit HisH